MELLEIKIYHVKPGKHNLRAEGLLNPKDLDL